MVSRLFSRKGAAALIAASSLVLASCSDSAENGDGASSTSEDTSSSATASDTSAAETDAASDSSDTIEIEDNHGTQTVPSPPQQPASLDNRTFEVLDQWGVELVAAPQALVPETISYATDEDIVDIGNHREPDLEALTAAEPDVIIEGQRFRQHHDAITSLNPDTPVVALEPREDEQFDQELIREVEVLGEIFGKEDEAQALIDDFNAAIERAKEAYDSEQTVMAVNVSGGNIGYIAPSVGRTYGPIFDMLGLTPALEVEDGSSDHEGDDISVEAIADSNPDWIFVLDRDAAVGDDGATPAEKVIEESQALQNVTAITEDNVVYAPADTYLNESIITYTEILNDIADAFEAA